MLTKIRATEIRNAITVAYNAHRTPLFVGPPGCAKTAMVRLAATDIARMHGLHPTDVPVIELHLATMSEVDVRGYLIPHGDQATFTKPVFWKHVEQHPRGILFLDEFMQATNEMQKTVAPLVYEGTVGDYTLPPGWLVVLAGNGVDDNAGANTLLSHVLNRVMRIEVDPPEVDMWVNWAAEAQLDPAMIAFAKLRPNVVFESGVPSEPDVPYCTPRSLHAASDIAKAYPGGVQEMVKTPFGLALLQGCIGAGATSELAAVVKLAMNLPTFDDVVANPDKVRVPTELSEQYCMLMLVAVRAKAELHGEQAAKYLTRFQPNMALTGIVALINRDSNFVNSKVMAKWVNDNRELLTKFHGYIRLGAGQ